MGKHRERHDQNDFDDSAIQAGFNELEYNLNDEDFFKQFQPKKTRQKTKSALHARRRIEQYWEDRKLAESLTEYYDNLND